VVIRPPSAPTAPPTAAPRAAPCPPAAAAPIAAPLPAPMRPPPIVRWTGSYGLVQADKPSTSPAVTTQAEIRRFVSSLIITAPPDRARRKGAKDAVRNAAIRHIFRKRRALRRYLRVSFLGTLAHNVHGEDCGVPTRVRCEAACNAIKPTENKLMPRGMLSFDRPTHSAEFTR
jgi:hypothetical protein